MGFLSSSGKRTAARSSLSSQERHEENNGVMEMWDDGTNGCTPDYSSLTSSFCYLIDLLKKSSHIAEEESDMCINDYVINDV